MNFWGAPNIRDPEGLNGLGARNDYVPVVNHDYVLVDKKKKKTIAEEKKPKKVWWLHLQMSCTDFSSLLFFHVEADIVLSLFLNFEQN